MNRISTVERKSASISSSHSKYWISPYWFVKSLLKTLLGYRLRHY